MRRRTLLALPAALAPVAARAQQPPAGRPLRIVVPFAAGGVIDVVARILAEPLSRRLGQPVVVENLPGGGTTIGGRTVARAAADGQTLLLTGASQSVIPALYPDAGIDPVADFAPVALLGNQPFVVVVHPAVPAQDVAGLLAWLRAKKGEANFATTAIGAASHLSGELLKKLAGVDLTFVTYRGTPAAVTDLVAGRADMMIDSQTLLAPLARDGKVRALAVTTATRSRMLPDLPTLQEAGVPGFVSSSWQGLYAPAGTPAPVVARLAAAVAECQEEEAVQERYARSGVEPLKGGPDALRAFLAREMETWIPILRAAPPARAG
jgi:tripartite-type tricarboxylate transporter receptor subunit TctC